MSWETQTQDFQTDLQFQNALTSLKKSINQNHKPSHNWSHPGTQDLKVARKYEQTPDTPEELLFIRKTFDRQVIDDHNFISNSIKKNLKL